jgi:hypothetical protein
MARRYIRDKNGRFAAKGGGTNKSGRTVASRNAEDRAGSNILVGNNKAFKPYYAALGKSVYANRKVKKLEKAGADKSVIAKAKKDAAIKEATTAAARRQTFSQVKVNNRRYRNAMGLVKERRYARPR